MSKKPGEAKYTFAFAADLQSLANEKHVKLISFSVTERDNRKGSYDFLSVNFVVPRPDRKNRETTEAKPVEAAVEPDEGNTVKKDAQTDEPVAERLETVISELEEELDTTKKDEV